MKDVFRVEKRRRARVILRFALFQAVPVMQETMMFYLKPLVGGKAARVRFSRCG